MKIQEKTVFSCDFCNRKMFVKGAMTRHENICTKNPKNWSACIDCKFCEEKEEEFYYYSGNPMEDNETVRKSKSFRCTHLNQAMYPFAAEKKKLPTRFPETFEGQIRMPNKCEHYKSDIEYHLGF